MKIPFSLINSRRSRRQLHPLLPLPTPRFSRLLFYPTSLINKTGAPSISPLSYSHGDRGACCFMEKGFNFLFFFSAFRAVTCYTYTHGKLKRSSPKLSSKLYCRSSKNSVTTADTGAASFFQQSQQMMQMTVLPAGGPRGSLNIVLHNLFPDS